MTTRDLVINMDVSILDSADSLFEEMGIDTETAIKMFLKRVIKDRRMPYELVACKSTTETDHIEAFTSKPFNGVTRQSNKITREMCSEVWAVFKRFFSNRDTNLQEAARYINRETGMNSGSAFIYLNIINNLINGALNKRVLKYDDLLFFLERILLEFPDTAYQNAIKSLKVSIPYWEVKVPGAYADNIRQLVNSLTGDVNN